MPSFDDARVLILDNVFPTGVEVAALGDSLGRVIADDIAAPWDMPRYDNSAMDGFAVRAADCVEPRSIRVSGFLSAGTTPVSALEPGTALRIMTGAPLPPGCDAVIPFEMTEQVGDQMRPLCRVLEGQHIRFAGEDVKSGDVIVTAGTLVRPIEISMMASLGQSRVRVFRRPRVAIVSTGDELLELDETIAPGKIIDSNSPALAAAVRDAGAEPEMLGIAVDTVESHRDILKRGLEADVLITSAGVSAGDRDLVREVLAELGVRPLFCGVDVRPGGPTAFGVKDNTPVFCLPGNPVAALLTFETLVRPALLKMQGHLRVLKRPLLAVLQEPVQKKAGKASFLRVRLVVQDGSVLAYSAGNQNTGIFTTMLKANGIAILAEERTSYSPGDQVEVQLLSGDFRLMEP